MTHQKNRGFTLVELLVVIAIIALLVGLLLPALAKAQQAARETKDATQIKQIHTAMLSYAAKDKSGRLPLPGYINKCVTAGTTPTPAGENPTLNNTQNLYSSMIAGEYFKPDLCIGPTEVNPVVVEKGKGGTTPYNYSAYNPSTSTYWDTSFTANINSTLGSGTSNTSYAHMALFGLRKDSNWRSTQNANVPLVGTRAPTLLANGNWDPNPTTGTGASYATLLIGPKKEWWGNLVYADNHVDLTKSFYPEGVVFECGNLTGPQKDHIFVIGPFAQSGCYRQGCTATCTGGVQTGAVTSSGGDTWMGFFPGNITGCTIAPPVVDAPIN